MFKKPTSLLLSALVFLAPFAFWTATSNFFSTPKQILLMVVVGLLILTWVGQSIKKRSLSFTSTTLTLPLVLMIAAIVLNLILIPEARTEALINRGSLYLSLIALALVLPTLSRNIPNIRKHVLNAFIASSSLLAVFSILELTFLHNSGSLPAFFGTRAFTPAGSPLIAISFLLIGLVTSINWSIHTSKSLQRNLLFAAIAVQTIAVVAYFSLMLPGQELAPSLLPLTASWSVALDALKSPRGLLMGVGLANFSSFFTTVKPLFLNGTIFWNALPSSASSELLQLATTGGLILLIPLFLVFLTLVRSLRAHHQNPSDTGYALTSGIVTSLIIFLLTPGSLPVLIVLFTLLALFTPAKSTREFKLEPLALTIVAGLLTLLVVASSYYAGRVVLAEMHLRRAAVALAANDGQTVYQEHINAINLLPSLTSYHLSYSNVNLSLASAISQREDISEEDRNNISQLLSQAVREATVATQLRPSLSTTWQNRGNIYRQLINVADGADQFAVDNYATAVRLDPGNAALRIEYGGLFYQLAAQQTDDQEQQVTLLNRAIQQFSLATDLKSDFPNAWYNLSKALEAGGNFPQAYSAMQNTIASLDPSSPDLEQATKELDALREKLPAPSASPSPEAGTAPQEGSSNLAEPSPLPSPIPGGPIDLGEQSPAPSPAASPVPTPTPTP